MPKVIVEPTHSDSESGSDLDGDLDVKSMVQCLFRQQGNTEKWQKERINATLSMLSRMGDHMGYLHELIAELQATSHDKIEANWVEKMEEHERMLEEMAGYDDSSSGGSLFE